MSIKQKLTAIRPINFISQSDQSVSIPALHFTMYSAHKCIHVRTDPWSIYAQKQNREKIVCDHCDRLIVRGLEDTLK